ncbi:AI-2E family transporter [Turicibacter bilis]|uniref:AI-2E family transporter n=1 Tax=Turicibacter bilis TaxID=2735723 RepID=A0A9Q9CRY7_9FIRM|nr:AI-2E family transporter [Turicibacter bilis]MBS3197609.1 AI-2E family transporter [Turicibacter bilis]UUF08842.1 AI-2E family transporter [Turicibacter bilis]
MLEQLKKNKQLWLNCLSIFIVGVGLIFIYYILKNLGLITNQIHTFILLIRPVIIAFGIAYVLNRPMIYIEKKLKDLSRKIFKKELASGASRGFTILLLFILVVGSIYVLFNSIIPPIMKNLRLLLESLPMFQESMNYYIKELGPYVESFINQQQIDQISNFITNLLSAIGTQILQLGTGVITNVTGFAISTLTTIILSIYFLKDKEILINSVDKGAQALLSPRLLKRMKQLLHDLDVVFGGFLIAQLIAAILAGVFSTLILLVIRHPFAILVGLVTGVTNVIPYIGPILGALLGCVLGLFSSLNLAILSLILLTIYQQLDANVIQPKLLSNSVGLNPVWVLIAILIGGHYLGMVGMIVSIPSAALAQIYLTRRYHRLKKQQKI